MTIPLFEKLKLFCITVTLTLGACGGSGSGLLPQAPLPEVVAPVPDKRSVLRLELMDATSQALGTGPLKDNPYDSFSFLLNGNPVVVKSRAIDDAKTFAELRSAIDNAINALKSATPALANLAVTLGPNYTVFDQRFGLPVVGQSILLIDVGGGIITLNPTDGWSISSGLISIDFMYRKIEINTITP